MHLASIVVVVVTLASCGSSPKPEAKTERERDSVLGESKLPGAGAIKKAEAARDSAASRRAVEDTIDDRR